MNLANNINDLLYRYDCVIVPNFGGFVTHRVGAKLNKDSHTFYPPTKQIAFNSHLKHNDGLLTNYVASAEQISFEKATTAISLAVLEWQNELKTNAVQLDNLGTIILNEKQQIIFEPTKEINFLTTSFGLANVPSSLIKRKDTPIIPLASAVASEDKKGIPLFIKYAAAAAILLIVSFASYNGVQENKQKKMLASQQTALEKKIQTATFVIANPLPTLELNVVKAISKPYHVVAGSFQFIENADRKVKQLKSKGFNAKIIGINKWGLTQVAFNSYAHKNDAINSLNNIRRTQSKDAWFLVKTIK
jgi:hypothetical protein